MRILHDCCVESTMDMLGRVVFMKMQRDLSPTSEGKGLFHHGQIF
jgi:hypothetical protein